MACKAENTDSLVLPGVLPTPVLKPRVSVPGTVSLPQLTFVEGAYFQAGDL